MNFAKIAQSTGIIAVGTGVGQGVILLATPWLARIFTPAEFGLLGLMMTIGNIATAVACFRYDLAIPAASSSEVRSLIMVSSFCVMFSSLIAGVFYFGLQAFKMQEASAQISVVAVVLCVFFIGLQQTTLSLLTQAQSFWRIALIRILQGTVFALVGLLSSIGLVWSYVLSLCVFIVAFKVPSISREKDSPTLLQIAQKNKQFPILGLPGALLDVLGYSICIWVVTANYGATEAGQYTQIQRLVGAPLMLIGMSLTQVLLRYTADYSSDRRRLVELVTKLQNILFSIGALSVCLTLIFGEAVLGWFLGAQWRVDTQFITLIVLAVAIRACVSPLSSVLVTLKRLDLGLKWQATYFLSSLIVLGGAAYSLDFSRFILVYAVHEAVLYLYYLFIIKSSLRVIEIESNN